MKKTVLYQEKNKIILHLKGRICETVEELLSSDIFRRCLQLGLEQLSKRNSTILEIVKERPVTESTIDVVIQTMKLLTKMDRSYAIHAFPPAAELLTDPQLFNRFIEYLYDFWRSFDRFLICDSEGDRLDKRPYRTFNETIERLTHLVRSCYRDIAENVTQTHPRVYRQVAAGAEIAAICLPLPNIFQAQPYTCLNSVPVIRQVLLYPPLVITQPTNKRSGGFHKVDCNPFDTLTFDSKHWLCYPAKVGSVLIYIYFHTSFYELGFSLCNLFQLASDEDLRRKPDGIYAFGVAPHDSAKYGNTPTIFHDDTAQNMMVATLPRLDEFGYFGYLKKTVLTLHNIIMMKRGLLPFHGALVHILLQGGRSATILMIGDTGAGKSETLEALRQAGQEHIRDIVIIADDMGSLQITETREVHGFGTEIGAFMRLDDLQPGYAYGHLDRSIILNPSQVNARIIIPVTDLATISKGFPVDYILYVNNYELVDDDHPLVQRIDSCQQALTIFREGAVMSKGTTTSQGLTHSYFANIFGPPSYKELHEEIARAFFEVFYQKSLFVGQLRTRLGIKGYEIDGPRQAAQSLLRIILGEGEGGTGVKELRS